MSNIFDEVAVEIIEDVLISLEQAPVIAYDPIVAKGIEIRAMIDGLGLDSIEPTEENKALLKATRADLNKQFAEFEAKRGEIKKLVLAPYDMFEKAYKENISSIFNGADTTLKNKIGSIDEEAIAIKTAYAKKLFGDTEHPEWLRFETIGLKITTSKTESTINKEVLGYIRSVNNDIKAITAMENSNRILAKYQIFRDLSRAITEVNSEIVREREIARRREELEAATATPSPEPIAPQPEPIVVKAPPPEPTMPKPEPIVAKEKTFVVTLKIEGTTKQLSDLKSFLTGNNIKFEKGE